MLVEGREIRLGALTFVADDSAWLQEAPLDVNALPVREAMHFYVSEPVGGRLDYMCESYRGANPSTSGGGGLYRGRQDPSQPT